jgi:hypothetical protein
METIDYNLLKNNLKDIVCKIFNNYKKQYSPKDVCAFALYSDEDAMSISMAINTHEHLKNSIKEAPEYPLDFKYNPEEWKEIIEDKELEEYNKTLEDIYFKIKKKQFVEHKNNIYKLSVEIIHELKEEQYFKDFDNDFLLLFSISSFEIPETVIEYNKKYNNKNVSEEYEKWLKEMEEDDDEDE